MFLICYSAEKMLRNSRFVEGTPVARDYTRSEEELRDWLVTKVAAILHMRPLDLDVSKELESYGLGSRELVELSGELEELLGHELSPTLAFDFPTIASLASKLSKE
jgi:polyketide synthase 13